MIKVGDYISHRGLFGITLFAQVKSIDELDDKSLCYTVIGPEGEFKCYGPNKLTQKDAKNWIARLQSSIKFLQQV